LEDGGKEAMLAQEGIARLNRLSVYFAYCSLPGLTLWLIVFFTIGRWGLVELIFLTFGPILTAVSIRIIAWLLEGFFQKRSQAIDSMN
jgi:hypothetical protein